MTELKLLQAAVHDASDGIVITTVPAPHSAPLIVYTNPAFREMTGYSEAELLGQSISILRGPETDVREIRKWLCDIRNSTRAECEVLSYRKDGTRYWDRFRISAIYDSAGEVTNYISIHNDVTARKKTSASLENRDAILAALARMAERFLSSGDWKQEIGICLRELGEVTTGNRTFLYQLDTVAESNVSARLIHQWSSDQHSATMPDPPNPSFIVKGSAVDADWAKLDAGDAVLNSWGDFESDTHDVGRASCVRSIAVPVFVRGKLWGSLGVSTLAGRSWSQPEIDAIRAVGTIVGASISRNEAEAQLRSAQQRFDGLFKSDLLGIAIHKRDGQLLKSNQLHKLLFGYTDEQLSTGSLNWASFFPEESRERQLESATRQLQLLNALPTRKVTLRTLFGHHFDALTGAALCGENECITFVLDQSAQEHAARRLRESENRFRAAFEHAPIGLFVTSPSGCYLQINEEMEKVLGYSKAELIGGSYRDIIHPDDLERRHAIQQRFLGGHSLPMEDKLRYIHKDGQVRWCKVVFSVMPRHDGKLDALIIHIKDETQRILAEERQRNLLEILEATPDIVGILDRDLRLLHVNESGRLMFGLPKGTDLRSVSALNVYPAENRAAVTRGLEIAIRDGMWKGEQQLVVGGRFVPVLQTILSHKDASGNLKFISTVVRDISEQKEAERRRSELMRSIVTAQSDERRRVARELHDETGQSLTSILLRLQSILNDPAAEHVHDRVRQISELTATSLDNIGRLARGLHPTVLDDLGLEAALRRHVEDYAKAHGVRATLRWRGRLPQIEAEVSITVFRIVQEAMTNIAKHAHAKNVTVTITAQSPTISVEIVDDGCGFEVVRSKGQGLGLIGMEERATLLNGSFYVSSTRGKGTTITGVIPIQVSE